ncbi:Protein of unknown function (DUF3611) [Synechococcus sp. PCC 7502]|uniref:DUF3611 family protein n=1 Tax=Synechococcus sp. PCC 7502 TaxID=1173263 RepID=UPI00029FD848|nr:DUF3611 family protein [Synechococcus sp. PCC 7502]AFY73655.1 Protein of unknown function (DUF3611) [Synechococcus sp. PCC 7502]
MAKEDDTSLSTNVLKVVRALNMAGWIGFWAQSVLAVISTLILLFAIISRSAGGSAQSNPGTGAGTFLAFLGLIAVYLSIFWNFRYTMLAKELRTSDNRPSRAETIKQLKIGIIIGFVGMFITLLGAEAIVGVLVAKSLSQPQTAFVNPDSFNRLVQPIDIFIVQANTNTILAHFLGLVTSVWLLDRISK